MVVTVLLYDFSRSDVTLLKQLTASRHLVEHRGSIDILELELGELEQKGPKVDTESTANTEECRRRYNLKNSYQLSLSSPKGHQALREHWQNRKE